MSKSHPQTHFPCGCKMSQQGVCVVLVPCSETCNVYAEAIEESRKRQLPIQTVDLRKSGRISSDATCPYCGKGGDGFTGGSGQAPEPGDWGICLYCARVGVYTEGGIRKPTDDEIIEAESNDGLMSMVQMVQEEKKRRNRNLS